MRFYRLNIIKLDSRYCSARGRHPYDTQSQFGGPILSEMANRNRARLRYDLDEEAGALEPGDFLTGSCNDLGVSRRFADALSAFHVGPHELVPIEVYNAKGRVHIADAVLINPLEPVVCLDPDRSQMNGDQERPLVRIFGTWCLQERLIPPGRDLFRVKGLIGYVFSERLVDFIKKEGFTNFVFEPAPLS
jgi:hypothetical protein